MGIWRTSYSLKLMLYEQSSSASIAFILAQPTQLSKPETSYKYISKQSGAYQCLLFLPVPLKWSWQASLSLVLPLSSLSSSLLPKKLFQISSLIMSLSCIKPLRAPSSSCNDEQLCQRYKTLFTLALSFYHHITPFSPPRIHLFHLCSQS